MNQPTHLDDQHYDGIVEEDNPLPRWWVLLFIGTIIFAVIYVAYFHFGPGKSQQQELEAGMKKVTAMQQPVSSASQQTVSKDRFLPTSEALSIGKSVYDSKCASCHGMQGQGLIGPNLTDNAWISGDGSSQAIYDVIRDGVIQKGMLAWKDMLSESELNAVTVYVQSMQGSHPASPKAPEGNVVGQ